MYIKTKSSSPTDPEYKRYQHQKEKAPERRVKSKKQCLLEEDKIRRKLPQLSMPKLKKVFALVQGGVHLPLGLPWESSFSLCFL
jgi:hypothetical protein